MPFRKTKLLFLTTRGKGIFARAAPKRRCLRNDGNPGNPNLVVGVFSFRAN